MNPIGRSRAFRHRTAAFAFLLSATLAAGRATAVEPVNASRDGLAIDGYDTVAYFTEGMPTKGRPEHRFAWMGTGWLFSSAKNRELFAAEPARYAPQYGGYCAKAVSEGNTANIDPRAWKIVDGKLYLNYSLKVQELWQKDIPGRISRGDANWPKILSNGGR